MQTCSQHENLHRVSVTLRVKHKTILSQQAKAEEKNKDNSLMPRYSQLGLECFGFFFFFFFKKLRSIPARRRAG